MGRKKPVRENESLESSKQGGGGGGKSKKKNRVIDDDDYSVGTVVLEDKAEVVPEIGKKRGNKFGPRDEDDEKNLAKHVGGVGKSKKKNVAIDDDEYSIGTEISAEMQEEELAPAAVAFGKKKSKKGGVSTSDYGSLGQDDDDEDMSGLSRDRDGVVGDSDREAENVASVTGKTKNLRLGKSSASLFVTSALHAIDDEDNETGQLSEEDEESTVAFTGRSSGISFSAALLDEENDADTSLKLVTEAIEEDDAPGIIFSGKKKSSMKKNKSVSSTMDTAFGNVATNVADQDHCSLGVNREDADDNRGKKQTTYVLETSKNKTKKKRVGIQQQSQLGDDTGEREAVEEETVKSAAAKKKKKKKEKEKEKKAAAAAAAVSEMEEKQELTKNDTKGKLADKKQSKQVREMSRKDATKRPIYESKKSKAQAWANDNAREESVESTEVQENQLEIVSEVDSMETEKAEDIDLVSVEEKSEVVDTEENREDEEEWDARSWDDANLKLPRKSVFEDEKLDSDPQPIIKEAARSVVSDTGPLPVAAKSVIPTQKAVASVPAVTKNDGSKKREPEVVVSGQGTEKPGASSSKSEDNLRSPICCIMGHVDTGKTKLLDYCIRGTNIGATYFPAENIRERTKELKVDAKLKVPGLLVIDTPGDESFTNLRSRGSGLCDIAILVVDIMHGLELQTIESLNLLKMRNTEFIVALNKALWMESIRNAPIVKAMKQQSKDVHFEFNTRLTQVVTPFKEQGINTELYYKNKEMGKDTFSIIPTSAISGEGIPDLLLFLVQWTQKTMVERLTYSSEVQCTVLEVKAIEGHGTTIDVVLINGMLHEGDQIVVCGMQDPIVTSIRSLLTPHPMKELRIKGSYLHHKEIKAAQGININAHGLEYAIAGTSLYVVGPDDDVEHIKEAAMEDMWSVMSRIDRGGEGVYVQASTLGSLEALLDGIGIGPVHKKDVMKASVMLEEKKEYATILAFDVKVTQEAQELADEAGVKIFIADIIYHLFDQFKAYIDNLKEEKKKEVAEEAVFPCSLKIVPNHVYNKKDPIVVGVDVLEGIARVGTPICIPQREFIDIGRIASIENNHRPVDSAKKGQRAFEMEDELVSKVSRRSIDILKANFRNDLSIEDWRLVKTLKNLFKIQ
ncbi:hypothetical protein R3W88_000857 [Solanum pinnatisectum]|uniref:Eukaryotic translation initiation factor 5B n=1 Tax=Solanum pinnatisectum TaxID=50273 RepID=A0AAV9MJG5_9SOLN|nr:hypothetical protein R3W88_000857 [Solanum pinnatisectum]